VNQSTSAVAPTTVATALTDWSDAIDAALEVGESLRAAALAQVILKRLPRHLPTYQRLLVAAWQLKRWDEGEDWGRRLLRADPLNGLAWRALATAAEQRSQRAQAHATWQRAFETDPYAPEIRAGISRTALGGGEWGGERPAAGLPAPLALNAAALARLALRGYRWARAASLYRQLIEADARRIDFQVGLLMAIWQLRARDEAYRLARSLVDEHPHLLLAWVVLDELGDVNDRALARNPIQSMDPNGEFARVWLGLPHAPRTAELTVTPDEVALLDFNSTAPI
jgi:tetratricopeptide (TPR) repeat protein